MLLFSQRNTLLVQYIAFSGVFARDESPLNYFVVNAKAIMISIVNNFNIALTLDSQKFNLFKKCTKDKFICFEPIQLALWYMLIVSLIFVSNQICIPVIQRKKP